MPRVLIVAATTGYQTHSFGEAALRQGIDLAFATDRCHTLEDPWRDDAIPIRFHREDESVRAVLNAVRERPIDGVLALGDRPTPMVARIAAALGLPGHPPDAARAANCKVTSKAKWAADGLLVPWGRAFPASADPAPLAAYISYPCVLKPLTLSGSRGVIRVDDASQFVTAFERIRRLLRRWELRAKRDPSHDQIAVEGYIEGREYAVEALLEHGRLRVLAVFDKPDPLVGPYFEETIYVTPSRATAQTQVAIVTTIERAARVLGLRHGPIHAECRVNLRGVYPLEVAARPIGGLCARVLRFSSFGGASHTLEDVLLCHAAGRTIDHLAASTRGAGVMMLPIPQRGFYKGVRGEQDARSVPGIDELRMTAKLDQLIEPLPEGSSYLGFLFSSGRTAADAESALRVAHARLTFLIDEAPRMVNLGE
jgi:hypothetical protein